MGDRILIVDDEAQVANITKTVLLAEFAPNDIVVCSQSEEAIQILRNEEIAVLLCDMQMPVYDGTVVVSEAYKSNHNIVSIIVTARATKESMIKALNEGHIWRCLEKPWDAQQMCDTVKTALEQYRKNVALDAAAACAVDPAGPAEAPEPAVARGGAGKLVIQKGRVRPRMRAAGRRPGSRMSRASRGRAGGSRPSVIPRVNVKKPVNVKKKKIVRKTPAPGRKTVQKPEDLQLVDDRYRNLSVIKKGGSGVIYRADDSLLGMPVAIKVLAENIAQDKKSMSELFEEARIAMQLSHKHIVRLHNIQETNGLYYLVMEYIDGSTFTQILASRGALAPEMVIQMTDIFEDALGYAHRRGVYHRDLKPGNVMLSADGILKIIDFGLACLGDLKRDDEIRGTPYYMSPEEIEGTAIDQRSDIYSLSIMMHEFLTGELPRHAGDTEPETILDYRPLVYSELPEYVQHVLQKGFARSQAERWDDVESFSNSFRIALRESYDVV